jgi:hypothetical protein
MKYNAKFEFTDEQVDAMKEYFKKTQGIGKSKMGGRETIKKYLDEAMAAQNDKMIASKG